MGIIIEQSRETGNTWHTRLRKTRQKHNTHVLDTTSRKYKHKQRKQYIRPQTTGSKDESNIVSIRKSETILRQT